MRLIDGDELLKTIDCSADVGGALGKVVECIKYYAKFMVASAPTAKEQKTGKWIEKHHAYSDEESVIEEWQSCCCSECGRYDTRPYMYYFSEPNYCSYCGADMRGEQDEAD